MYKKKVKGMQLVINTESVSISIKVGRQLNHIHVCYWNLQEVEEDSTVAITMALAVQLFYTDQHKLLEALKIDIS
jgi:hypothetical protein